jgi:hypothetical protein
LAVGFAWLAGTGQTDLAAAENTGVITGVVTSRNGPEAGIWIIAETRDLDTQLRKMVVTNDQGRFLLPELPKASYKVWVRGYGLVDSKAVTATPGQNLQLTAAPARTPQEAAQVYPANYWYSLIEPPKPSEFPGKGASGNGVATQLQTLGQWIDIQKQGCMLCHQLGTKITREVADKAKFDSTIAAWDHRIQAGQRGAQMSNTMSRFGRQRGLQMFADWSDRIAAGEVPVAPPRPKGVERNVVITMWDWTNDVGYVHDEVATDKRNPRVNANGPVYGVDIGNDYLTVTDPVAHTSRMLKIPLRAAPSTVPAMFPVGDFQPSRFSGMKDVHNNPANPHNPMMDSRGRVWITTQIRAAANPDWCTQGSDHQYAKYFPLQSASRHAGFYDPKAQKFVLIDTCYTTHHLQFAEDADDTLYFSGGGQVIGWINTKMYDRTSDERMSQGWCPTVLDTNGDGKITKPWNEPIGGGRATEEGGGGGRLGTVDPKLDTRVNVGSYGIVYNPADGSVWVASTQFPGRVLRMHPGNNPPETCVSELYEVPSELQGRGYGESGYGPRGIDITRDGVVWTALSGSSHFASFDRRMCNVLNGPTTVNGRHCNEGWTLYPTPGPSLKGTNVRADYHYYSWVDQFNTLGLGENIPIANGSNSDALLALAPATGEWVVLRVPYPLGFFSRGLDGRIDDPNGGWKGRGVYATYGAAVTWHTEAGYGARPSLVKFQVRPDPLAN